jgi:hypothetical protein
VKDRKPWNHNTYSFTLLSSTFWAYFSELLRHLEVYISITLPPFLNPKCDLPGRKAATVNTNKTFSAWIRSGLCKQEKVFYCLDILGSRGSHTSSKRETGKNIFPVSLFIKILIKHLPRAWSPEIAVPMLWTSHLSVSHESFCGVLLLLLLGWWLEFEFPTLHLPGRGSAPRAMPPSLFQAGLFAWSSLDHSPHT